MRLAVSMAVAGTGAGFCAWGLLRFAATHRSGDLLIAVAGFALAFAAALTTAVLVARR